MVFCGFKGALCHNLFRDGVCEHGQTTGHNTQVPQSPFKVFCFFLYVQLKERIIFKTSSGLLSPVNAVIFPIKISFNLHQLSSILMCKKKKRKGKQRICRRNQMSDWKVTLRPCCRVKTFPPSLRGRERGERERGRGAVRQDAACPQDAHKYPCKLQFKRNQYELPMPLSGAVMKVC